MKFRSLKYFPITLNFINQFKTSITKQTSRRTFILELSNDQGEVFYGEAAPLPAFGSESFDETEIELQRVTNRDTFECEDSLNDLAEFTHSLSPFSSIQFGLEHIFLQQLLKRETFQEDYIAKSKAISVNALVDVNELQVSKLKLSKFVAEGYSIIKLKVDGQQVEDLIELIEWADNEFSSKLMYRIDPNGSWTVEETIRIAERLEQFPIEYIEQPVKKYEDLVKISVLSPIPIAADESVRSLSDAEKLINNTNVKFLVIKPMLFGGISEIQKLQKLIEGKDIKVIISSALESNIGKRHLTLIASTIDNSLAHGLGTSELFINQTTDDVFKVDRGIINFSRNKYVSKMKVDLE